MRTRDRNDPTRAVRARALARLRAFRGDAGDEPADRTPRRVRTVVRGRPDDGLADRVAALERAVEENRMLNQRLSDVVDVVTELLVPAVDRDDERLRAALAALDLTLDEGGARRTEPRS